MLQWYKFIWMIFEQRFRYKAIRTDSRRAWLARIADARECRKNSGLNSTGNKDIIYWHMNVITRRPVDVMHCLQISRGANYWCIECTITDGGYVLILDYYYIFQRFRYAKCTFALHASCAPAKMKMGTVLYSYAAINVRKSIHPRECRTVFFAKFVLRRFANLPTWQYNIGVWDDKTAQLTVPLVEQEISIIMSNKFAGKLWKALINTHKMASQYWETVCLLSEHAILNETSLNYQLKFMIQLYIALCDRRFHSFLIIHKMGNVNTLN